MTGITYVPPQLARPRTPVQVRRVTRWVRDPYYFAHYSTSHGPDQPAVAIPAAGPGAAGSTFPNNQPQVESVEIQASGTRTDADVYGVNTQ